MSNSADQSNLSGTQGETGTETENRNNDDMSFDDALLNPDEQRAAMEGQVLTATPSKKKGAIRQTLSSARKLIGGNKQKPSTTVASPQSWGAVGMGQQHRKGMKELSKAVSVEVSDMSFNVKVELRKMNKTVGKEVRMLNKTVAKETRQLNKEVRRLNKTVSKEVRKITKEARKITKLVDGAIGKKAIRGYMIWSLKLAAVIALYALPFLAVWGLKGHVDMRITTVQQLVVSMLSLVGFGALWICGVAYVSLRLFDSAETLPNEDEDDDEEEEAEDEVEDDKVEVEVEEEEEEESEDDKQEEEERKRLSRIRLKMYGMQAELQYQEVRQQWLALPESCRSHQEL